ITPASISLLLRCNDHVTKMVAILKEDPTARTDDTALLEELRHRQCAGAEEMNDESPVEPIEAFPSAHATTHDEVQPPHATPAATAPAPARSAPPPSGTGNTPADESIRVSLKRLEKLLNYVGEMVILQTVLKEQSGASATTSLRKTVEQMGKVTKEIQDLSMSLRMVPLKQTFQKMQRIVRDTSASLGKKVQLNIQGEETELDKTVLENLSDPLVHLIRNAVDHGIETTEARRAAGKSDVGQISLSAFHQSGNLVIEVRDDGGGINADRLREKAIEKGVLKPGQILSDRETYQLIFHSGFSTKAVVSDVSGRGVGMDVVKTNIERLQGEIQIETELGKGTCFRVSLPLTLAIIDGMIIRCANERYVIPLSHVHESLRPQDSDVHAVSGLGEVLCLRGDNIPLMRLSSLFQPQSIRSVVKDSTVIVCRFDSGAFAVMVDDIIGQQQVVIKQLGAEHRQLRGFSGSAILGDGRPALILELSELVKRYRPESGASNSARRLSA
ncbi:MAG: chemotaxis protein CheA, partial [Bdellovibrionaceae bacterium]|nr:chemotaxis protein CheA [Pseudobdellovibrionaceae bacterium]